MNIPHLSSQMSRGFIDAWLSVVVQDGWNKKLGRDEDWIFWVFIAGDRNYV